MFAKILLIGATVALTSARPQDHHGFSSQSFVLHASNDHKAHHVSPHLESFNQHHKTAEQGQEAHHEEHHVDYYAHPKYEYEYKVADSHTGDQKYHHEHRDGDAVHGVYSLHEADGTVRIVKYSADKHNGFNAEVIHEGHATHVEPQHNHHHH